MVANPFSIIITPLLAKKCSASYTSTPTMERWTERQSIIVYVCLHWIASAEM